MPATKAFVIPRWVRDLKETSPLNVSLLTVLPRLMHWITVEHMELELLQCTVGAGITSHLETLFQEIKTQAQDSAQRVVARLSLSNFIRNQIFITLGVDGKKPEILSVYVLRISGAGLIEGIRRAAEHQQ